MVTRELITCPSTKVAINRRHTIVNRQNRPALHLAEQTMIRKSRFLDRNWDTRTTAFRADCLVFGRDGPPNYFLDVAVTCSTAYSFPVGEQRRRKATVCRECRENSACMNLQFFRSQNHQVWNLASSDCGEQGFL